MHYIDQVFNKDERDINLKRALNLLKSGQIEQSLAEVKSTLSRSPSHPQALVLAFDCFKHYGKEIEALGLIQKARTHNAQITNLHLIEAEQLKLLQRHDEALHCLRTATTLHPNHLGLSWKLILQLQATQQFSEALAIFEKNRELYRSFADYRPVAVKLFECNYKYLKALEEARSWYEESGSSDSGKRLAKCYILLNHHWEYTQTLVDVSNKHPNDKTLLALKFEALLDNSPKNESNVRNAIYKQLGTSKTCHDLTLTCSRFLLGEGNFRAGWKLYDQCLAITSNNSCNSVKPLINYSDSIVDHNILLVTKQGISDVLKFARFLPYLVKEANHVVLLVDEQISAMMKRSYPSVTVVQNHALAKELVGEKSLCLAISSLAIRYANTYTEIQESEVIGSLKVHPAISHHFSLQINSQMMNIGLSLTASAQQNSYEAAKYEVPPSLVINSLSKFKATIHDLQNSDPISNKLRSSQKNLQIIEYNHITKNFDQLIAIISKMDLMITSDQNQALIAGNLGIPTIVIVPPNPHFIFMRDGTSTPWFRKLSILRSTKWQCWQELRQPLEVLITEKVIELKAKYSE